MISSIRRLFGSSVGKFIALAFVVLIGVGFALGDVTGQGTFGGLGGANVASVGSTEIGVGELRDRVRRGYENARQDQPGLTMEAFIASGGIDQTLDQLIEAAAFEQYAREIGISASKRLVDGRIADTPAFAGVSGNFDQSSFEAFLRQNGLTEVQIRQEIALRLMFEQLIGPTSTLASVSPGLARPYAALLLEQRRGEAVYIPSMSFAPTADPGDATLQTFLKQNSAKYSIPERRVVQYATFDRASIPVPAITDAEIAEFYKKNPANFQASETRRISQVIAPSRATADAILAKAKTSSLEAAAQASGLSASTTGELTLAAYTATSGDVAAKAVFAAERGALVGPIQGSLGWTVARVETVTGKPARDLAAATPEIRTQLAQSKANEVVIDYFNKVQDAANGGVSIQEIAADRKLQLLETPALLPDGSAPGSADFKLAPEFAPLIQQAFQSVGEGEAQITTLVQNEKFAVFTVKSIIASAPPPFAQVRGKMLEEWRLAEGQKVARDKARAIVKSAEAGKPLGEASRGVGGNIGTVQSIGGTRADISRGERVPPELALLFSMAQGSVKTLEIPGNRGWMVISLGKVERPALKDVQQEQVSAIATPLAAAFGQELAAQMMTEAKKRTKIKINKDLVEQLRKELTGTLPVTQ